MFTMPDRISLLLCDMGVDPEKVDSFTLSWDRFEGAKLEFRMEPTAELVEINITKEVIRGP